MPDDQISASIGVPARPDYLRPTYANQVNITHTPHDFRLLFSVFSPPLDMAVQPGDEITLTPDAVAEVIIPASLMHGLVSALQAQFAHYLTQFGPPGMNLEGGPE